MKRRQFLRFAAAFLGACGIAAAAFGSHGLEKMASPEGVRWWAIAAAIQLLTAPVILQVSMTERFRALAGQLLVVGVCIFCGSLYSMTLGAPRWFGVITPLGGFALIAGWFVLAWPRKETQVSGE